MTKIKSKVEKNKVVMVDNIHKLPFLIFKDCVVRQDFIGLCLSGVPTVEDFFTCWDKLYFDYLEAVGGKEFKDESEKLAIWSLKQSRLVRFEQLIRVFDVDTDKFDTVFSLLDNEDGEKLYNLLFDFGYDVEKKPFSIETLKATVLKMIPYFKLDKTRLEIELAEQQDGVKSETVPYTDEYFDGILIEIGIALKIEINEQNLSLGKFCSYLNRYKSHRDVLEKELLKHGIN